MAGGTNRRFRGFAEAPGWAMTFGQGIQFRYVSWLI